MEAECCGCRGGRRVGWLGGVVDREDRDGGWGMVHFARVLRNRGCAAGLNGLDGASSAYWGEREKEVDTVS